MNTQRFDGGVRVALFLCTTFLSGVFSFGCASTSGGTRSSGYAYFYPQNSLTILNNTSVLIDVEYAGHSVVKDLSPGQSYTLEKWSFSDGEEINLIAKGHTKEGEYVGSCVQRIRLTSGYRGVQHQSPVWEVNNLRAPRPVGR